MSSNKTITPLELAEKYLIKIGVDKLFVQRSLIPSLFSEQILCKEMRMSDVVLSNKKGSTSNETHIFINKTFSSAFFNASQKSIYESAPTSANNQLSSQKISLFEANVYEALNRRNKKISSSIIVTNANNTYSAKSSNLINTTTTKWLNQHNNATQLHIGQNEKDGSEFIDFRLGILIGDYLLMFKYANKDCILALSIPKEFYSKYNVTNTQRINRKSSTNKINQRNYQLSDYEYSSSANDTTDAPETTPLSPISAPKGVKRNGSAKVKYHGKTSRGKGALDKAGYLCEYNTAHKSFISEKSGKPYMEPHHLIPISNQGLYEHDIDITSNLICLCPLCHKQIHHGRKPDVKKMLDTFFTAKRKRDLKTCGIEIDIETLYAYYDVF